MRAGESAARERGASRATLSVSAANERAIHFYRRLGYRALGADDLLEYARERGLEACGDRLRVEGRDYLIYRKRL
jgi:RimJ/RimL family protein N-acetyltransferase